MYWERGRLVRMSALARKSFDNKANLDVSNNFQTLTRLCERAVRAPSIWFSIDN